MNYYEYLLLDQNRKRIVGKRILLWLGIIHFVLGIVFTILAGLVTWRWIFVPLVWGLWGFVPANIGYLLVTDYKYVWQDDILTIYKHRMYGKYKVYAVIPQKEIVWAKWGDKVHSVTNCEPTVRFVYNDELYLLSCDAYMTALLRGDCYVFGQCRDNQSPADC